MDEHVEPPGAGKVQITAYCNILILGYNDVDGLERVANTIANCQVPLSDLPDSQLMKHGMVTEENTKISFLLCCADAHELDYGVEAEFDRRMNFLQEMCAKHLPDGITLIILVAKQDIFLCDKRGLRGIRGIMARFHPETAKHSWLAFTDVKSCTELDRCIERLKEERLLFLGKIVEERVFHIVDDLDSKQKLPDLRKQSIMLAVPEVFEFKKPPEEKQKWKCPLF